MGNGKIAHEFFTIERTNFGVIAAFDNKNRVVMIRQYRQSIGKISIELPAGHFEKNESPVKGIRRELLEETGYTVGKIYPLGIFYSSPGIMEEKACLYTAEGAKKAATQNFDEHEEIEVLLVPFKKALSLVYKGIINDMGSVIALLKLEKIRK